MCFCQDIGSQPERRTLVRLRYRLCQLLFLFFLASPAYTQVLRSRPPRIEAFSPRGVVKQVRQVQVRFSEQMVSFGDPGVVSPFEIQCPEKGRPAWVDGLNWVYDFERLLPAGIQCEFQLRDNLTALNGAQVLGQTSFRFSTGGPAIVESIPREGRTNVDEHQIFILQLDGEVVEDSILSKVYFKVEDIHNGIGVRIISGSEREAILATRWEFREGLKKPTVLVQAKQTFPSQKRIHLVWGRGVQTKTGVATNQDQVLSFRTRPAFTATFHCQRENSEKGCIPFSGMRLSFSAPISRDAAEGIALVGAEGKIWEPEKLRSERVDSVRFKAPFPPEANFLVKLSADVRDDAGRSLVNENRFPLAVRTDEYPPLAKFSGRFGILEAKANPRLPLTVRKLEADLDFAALGINPPDILPARLYRVDPRRIESILWWLWKIHKRDFDDRGESVFDSVSAPQTTKFTIPTPNGPGAFEVVGIPIPRPGFYVVELESRILGNALLGKDTRMYVPTTVLVTNLAVHFKWGLDSSIAWVTALDSGEPVKDATVEVRDCEAKLLWEGRTDANGVVRIEGLPANERQKRWSARSFESGFIVTAQFQDDLSFVHSSWNQGIEAWRFRLPIEYDSSLLSAHTLLDRSLLRAGETLHMKHILRKRATSGFSFVAEDERPTQLVIQQPGADQELKFPLTWDTAGSSQGEWTIPRAARLGRYSTFLATDDDSWRGSRWYSGSFRVEEYRVPLMRGSIRAPSSDLIRPSEIEVDLSVEYLAGGGAAGLPVRLRYEPKPRARPSFPEFEGFTFANGQVQEGLIRGGRSERAEAVELKLVDLTLDSAGSVRTSLPHLPGLERPMEMLAELEFKDPNGETQTVSSRIPIWPSEWLVGIKPESWLLTKDALRFSVAVSDLKGKPVPDAAVQVDLLERKTYSHRKRLVGGFYGYEHFEEIKSRGFLCGGTTNEQGLLLCESTSPVSGRIVLQASVSDSEGRASTAHRSVRVAGEEEAWFRAQDHDRIDILPEKRHYQAGETAKLEVRMPFREATALVSVEREGVGEVLVRRLTGKNPVIEVPVLPHYAPNVFVSVLVVRGRVGESQPTALLDLAKPAYKLGIAELKVGWRDHQLKVEVTPERQVYKVREKALVEIEVRTAEGALPPEGTEVTVVAVDEGLLELQPNESWRLLDAMMGQRRYGVETFTAQMQVVGKRHFGLKALPHGGGGGKQMTRELFDTLLLWKSHVVLDSEGQASVEVPLNDSVTSFRIVAIATGGPDRFGTGAASIRATQDLMIFSGVAPMIREGDRVRSDFTVRNASQKDMNIKVAASIREVERTMPSEELRLRSGQSRVVGWEVTAPADIDVLTYEIEVSNTEGPLDRIAVKQKVVPLVPTRPIQATIARLDKDFQTRVERPANAVAGKGGLRLEFRRTLLNGLGTVKEYMRDYPYNCFEQRISRAVALDEERSWRVLMQNLPAYLDADGLVRYFPSKHRGSPVLTSYVLALGHEVGWEIPTDSLNKMVSGLRGFIEGIVIRPSPLSTADLSVRILSAIEALSRYGQAKPELLSGLTIVPNLWPTSAVIDWFNILSRMISVSGRKRQLQQAEQVLRSRLDFRGRRMSFSTEGSDRLWWLMVSTDANVVRLILSLLETKKWDQDMPRLVQGALSRQQQGHWDLTTANAWGMLAMRKFSQAYQREPPSGLTTISLETMSDTVNWADHGDGKQLTLDWPSSQESLSVAHTGRGQPWLSLTSLAAIPLKEAISNGFLIRKTLRAVEVKDASRWSVGDILRVRLQLEAQSDMTWVALSDPIPAGTVILGSGLGRDSQLLTQDEERGGRVWPSFEERSLESFRAYYDYVPQGEWTFEYTIRLNNPGAFNLPPTRIEALYFPEIFGESPNPSIRVHP